MPEKMSALERDHWNLAVANNNTFRRFILKYGNKTLQQISSPSPKALDRNIGWYALSAKMLFTYTIILVMLLGLIGCDVQMYSKSEAEYMEKNVGKIKINMTKQELRDMFGRPNSYEPKLRFFYDEGGLEKATTWLYLYPNDDFSHRIDFAPDTGKVIKAEKESAE